MITTPQEIVVRYVLPSFRNQLALILVNKYKQSQSRTAKLLGITKSAVSQYISGKRGNYVEFNFCDLSRLDNIAQNLIKNKTNILTEIILFSNKIQQSKYMCILHKMFDTTISNNCNICFNNINSNSKI